MSIFCQLDSVGLLGDSPRDRVGRRHRVQLQADQERGGHEVRRRLRSRTRHDRKGFPGLPLMI
jgi:hypothetical protein